MWHGRLAHMSQTGLRRLLALGYIPDLQQMESDFCEFCQYGKQTRSTHSTHYDMVREPLELIQTDLCGPMPERSLGGARHFITFVDDATRRVWAYPLKTKDEALSTFTWSCTEVELQSGRKVNTPLEGSRNTCSKKESVTNGLVRIHPCKMKYWSK